MKTALVVIDVQNFFVNDKTKDLPSKIASFIEKNKFDFVLFTQFVNKQDSNFFKLLNFRKSTNSPDIDIHPSLLKFVNKDNLYQKSAYSIFKSPKLINFIRRNNITKFFLCRIDSDSCILASAFDAFDLGYEVKVLKQLIKSHSGEEFDDAALRIIHKSIDRN